MIETEAVVAQGTLKLTCSRDELLRGLGIVSRGVSTRTTVQILSGILLRAAEGKLELAVAHYRQAVALEPDNPAAHYAAAAKWVDILDLKTQLVVEDNEAGPILAALKR